MDARRFVIVKYTAQTMTVASLMVERAERAFTLSTGITSLDKILEHGGLRPGRIYEVFGPPGVGKTQLVMHLSAENSRNGRETMYIDTKNDFSSLRFHDMLQDEDKASSLHLAKVFSLADLVEVTASLASSRKLPKKAQLFIVDNLASLVWPELGSRKMTAVMAMMRRVCRNLRTIASRRDAVVVIVNNMTSKFKPSLGKLYVNVVDASLHFESKTKISLVKVTRKNKVIHRIPIEKIATADGICISKNGFK